MRFVRSLVVDQATDPILACEAGNRAAPVRVNPADEIVGHTDVEDSGLAGAQDDSGLGTFPPIG